jgi:hypothetical protein
MGRKAEGNKSVLLLITKVELKGRMGTTLF